MATGWTGAPVAMTAGRWTILRAGSLYGASRDGAAVSATWNGSAWDAPPPPWATWNYEWDSAKPWGPSWEGRRPPGIPPARPCGVSRGADPDIRALGAELSTSAGLRDAGYRQIIRYLAVHESGARYGRPANTYNLSDSGSTISAWGCFQFNRGAWERLQRRISELGPFGDPVAREGSYVAQVSPREEIEGPMRHYLGVYLRALQKGCDTAGAMASVFLFHSGPAYAASWWRSVETDGQRGAWSEFPRRYAGRDGVDSEKYAKASERLGKARRALDRSAELGP